MLLVLLTLCGACGWKGEGLVEKGALGPTLLTPTGKRYKVVHGPEDAALAGLDGYRVLVARGTRVFGTLNIREWTVPEGLSGMAVFIGTLERRGVQLGLTDHNSGGYYLMDADSWEQLAPHIGTAVAVEGYVDGPHRVKVLRFTVLGSPR